MSIIHLTLPEFVFLDDDCHEPSVLSERAVFQHIKSLTIFEVFDKADAYEFNKTVKTIEFEHIDIFGDVNTYVLAVHCTFATSDVLPELCFKAATWYRDYCNWEDRNSLQDM